MPVIEHDPWRQQYFEGLDCPDDLLIPTDDGDAYRLYPKQHWVYNKLLVVESQELDHAPHGITPDRFPVFSKPIYNMRGMGAESRVFRTEAEYLRNQRPGHMWMPLFEGEHLSTDAAVIDGEAQWWRHTIGHGLEGGMFDFWQVLADDWRPVEDYCGEWLRKHLKGYTGMVNFETIGAKIIEVHLRFSDQWPDLYGRGWLEALVALYRDGTWTFADDDRREGYSVVLFGAHGIQYRHPAKEVVDEVLAMDGVTSVQVTFHEDRPPKAHSMPPGGFRLAIVNCWDLEQGRRAREKLALSYWSTQQLLPTRARKNKKTPA